MRNFAGALRRVFPGAMTDSQSIAFSMFLAFFPMLLFALGLLTLSPDLNNAAREFIINLGALLPLQIRRMVRDFLIEQGKGSAPQTWILLGVTGTLYLGSQVMNGFLQAIRNLNGDKEPVRFWRQQWRAFLLLLITIVPLFSVIILTVFGGRFRDWMIYHFGLPRFFNGIWGFVYITLAVVLAMLVLTLLYRTGRFDQTAWNDVIPGAIVATIFWSVANTAFGWYMRQVPYSVVYGGLAATIGMLVWMNLCALIILVGAAYNAEAVARRK
ncbi:MAG TPA: YihY/virulence factor BrkB family protein [Candidatus Acidoferrales bacterium]|nr:YihY/virulence factor BrkB family protein [Candidatus Acidoferrales bacterium]